MDLPRVIVGGSLQKHPDPHSLLLADLLLTGPLLAAPHLAGLLLAGPLLSSLLPVLGHVHAPVLLIPRLPHPQLSY